MKVILSILTIFILAACVHEKKVEQNISQDLPEDSLYQIDMPWQTHEGHTIKLADLRGKSVVISMVYMSCQYSCPLTLTYMKEIEKKLDQKTKEKVQFVLVSFDPKRDTPEKMREYAKKMGLKTPPWIFLSTEKEQDLRELAALLDFKYKKLPDGEFEHSFSIIGLSDKGVIRAKLDGIDLKPEDLVPYLDGRK